MDFLKCIFISTAFLFGILLTERGARAVIHPVTKYSPLYIAAYNGKKDIVEILLKKFPELINVQTVEKWLPLHAACFNGHSQVLEFLLKYRSGRCLV
jgi:ankyrin repeat protein